MTARVLVFILDRESDLPREITKEDLAVFYIGGEAAPANSANSASPATRRLSPADVDVSAILSSLPATPERPDAALPLPRPLPLPPPLPPLSARERQVLAYIASGLTHGQTATRMQLTKATVDTYVERIRRKLGAGNKADLTRAAVSLELSEQTIA